jgi:hypothetical protein
MEQAGIEVEPYQGRCAIQIEVYIFKHAASFHQQAIPKKKKKTPVAFLEKTKIATAGWLLAAGAL